jgi:cephalosporin hydroxylase
MKFLIDTTARIIRTDDGDGKEIITPLYSKEGFELVSEIWLKQEWNQLHWQSFSWFNFPIWQFPDDLLRLQEVIVSIKPDVIIETGVSRGGSSIFFATMCRLLGKGKVISIDITIPTEIQERIRQTPFSDLITLIEGDSASPDIIEQIHQLVGLNKRVFVFLDSDHSKAHVLRELNAYSSMVTPGSYIVAADGVMRNLTDTPWGNPEWINDNPAAAAQEFAALHKEFIIKRPVALFGEEHVVEALTYWPSAWLYRLPD